MPENNIFSTTSSLTPRERIKAYPELNLSIWGEKACGVVLSQRNIYPYASNKQCSNCECRTTFKRTEQMQKDRIKQIHANPSLSGYYKGRCPKCWDAYTKAFSGQFEHEVPEL